MLAKDARAGATPVAPDAARAPAPGQVSRTQGLGGTTTASTSGTVPVGYLAGSGGAGAGISVIDAEAELISILARLEFMGTFVDVGSDRAAIIDELSELRTRIDAIGSDLAPARLELALERLHATEDVVLAGLQERVVGAAEREEQAGVDENHQAGRARVLDYARSIGWTSNVHEQGNEVIRTWTDDATGAPMSAEFQWCGAFAGHTYVATGGLDPELARAFSSAPSLRSFFRYSWGSRNPQYIEVDGAWISVDDYHAARGSLRRWWSGSEIEDLVATGGFAALPIRPGDIVIINNDDDDGTPARKGPADHVAMVQSWDGAGLLVTIEGNTAQLVGPGDDTVEDGIHRDVELHRTANRHGGKRVHGIGRPSLVDLEVHRYREDLP